MRKTIRIANVVNLVSSLVPLLLLTIINFIVLFAFFADQSGDYSLMAVAYTYAFFLGPLCLIVTMIYALIWYVMLILTIIEFILAKTKMPVAVQVMDILINICSYIMTIWLAFFMIFSFVFFIALIIFYIDYFMLLYVFCNISIGAMIISFVISVIYTVGLFMDRDNSKGAKPCRQK